VTINVDLRSLQGHELAFLIHILTDETTALLNVFPPLGLELLDVLQNELHGRAEKKLGEWQVTLTFDYAADELPSPPCWPSYEQRSAPCRVGRHS
jgi:hypothetical protein